MRKSMPAKRYLLIALALWAVASYAQMSGWTYSSAYHFTNPNDEQLTGIDLNKMVSVKLGSSVLDFENRLVFTDRVQFERQQRTNDRFQLTLRNHTKAVQAMAFYRGEYFDKCDNPYYMSYYPEDNLPVDFRTYNQQVGGRLDFNTEDNVYGSVSARHRTFWFEPSGNAKAQQVQTNNINASFTAGYRILKPLAIFTTGTVKQAMDQKTDLYDYSSGGVGLAFDLPVMYINHISATSKIEWLDGKLLSGGYDENWNPIQTTQRLMPITSEVRITQAITPQIMSFVSYQNRAFWDKGAEQMLLNSEFVRAQLKYNFTYDLSLGSFAEIGAKFSPELEKSRGEDEILKHKSSVIFAKGEFQTLKGLYLGGGYSQMPDRLNRYEGIVRAFITPVNEIFVNYIYTDDVEFDARTSYAGAGVRMMF